jgi:hypothetical protein
MFSTATTITNEASNFAQWSSSSAEKSKWLPVMILGSAICSAMGSSTCTADILDKLLSSTESEYHDGSWRSSKVYVEKRVINNAVMSIADMILSVKVKLGLPNKDIASIFDVTRQTLHSYSKGAEETQSLKEETKQRIINAYGVIEQVSKVLVKSPGAMAKNYTMDGDSLLGLLSSPSIDVPKVLALAKGIAEKSLIPNHQINESTLNDLTFSA